MCRSSLSLKVLKTEVEHQDCVKNMWRPTGTEAEEQFNYFAEESLQMWWAGHVSEKRVCGERAAKQAETESKRSHL